MKAVKANEYHKQWPSDIDIILPLDWLGDVDIWNEIKEEIIKIQQNIIDQYGIFLSCRLYSYSSLISINNFTGEKLIKVYCDFYDTRGKALEIYRDIFGESDRAVLAENPEMERIINITRFNL